MAINKFTFTTVLTYIDSFTNEQTAFLHEVYQIIKKYVPTETVEKISYNMPTFYYNGNLLHFALYKNHLGIYPGSEAIEHFQKQLSGFKTSKGAIQIPLNKPFPEKLIAEIIQYNVSKLKDKSLTNWNTYKSKWIDAEEFMQQLIVKTNLNKTIKWGAEVYTYNDKNIVSWHGFKDFFSIWFYNGVFLKDTENVLINASDGKTKALRQWRFTSVVQMNEEKITAYINEAINNCINGKELKPESFKAIEPEEILKDFLANNFDLNTAFNQLTKGKQKEYIIYINEAKQEKTKLNRLEKIKPLILEGKGLNDKYKSK